MEEKLATGLGKGQISEFVQDDEVHPGQMLSKPALTRPRAPDRMQVLAMAMAKWVLPVPIPPTSTRLVAGQ